MSIANKQVYLKISNKGELDINGLRLLGASSKREDESKIGCFGSGLKYAIAVLLRNNIDIKIFSGTKEIKISTIRKKFRDQVFNVIKFNNQLTSLTTEMGNDWKVWYAIREIYCNALDEIDSNITVSDTLEGEKGKTIFYILFNEELKEISRNWGEYFSDKRKDIIQEDSKGKVFCGNEEKTIVYRKGINVYQNNESSIFHYNLDKLKINESRVVTSNFELHYELVDFLSKNANEEVIRRIYDDLINKFEENLDWSCSTIFNENWLNVLGGRTIILKDVSGWFIDEINDNTIILPNKLGKALKDFFKEKVKIKGYSDKYGERKIEEFNKKQKIILDECINFIKDEIPINDYQIKLCRFEHSSTLGEAIDDTILLSPKVFDFGKKEIVSVLIEEYSHLDSKAVDKTRSFQNYLIKKYVSLLEDKKNIYL